MSETIILQNKKGTTLYKDRLIYQGNTYRIADMKQASTNKGFFAGGLKLVIEFRNGQKQEFKVGQASRESFINDMVTGGLQDNTTAEIKRSIQQWVTTINMLIAMSS